MHNLRLLSLIFKVFPRTENESKVKSKRKLLRYPTTLNSLEICKIQVLRLDIYTMYS